MNYSDILERIYELEKSIPSNNETLKYLPGLKIQYMENITSMNDTWGIEEWEEFDTAITKGYILLFVLAFIIYVALI